MERKKLVGKTVGLLKAFGLIIAVAFSLFYAGAGSTLSGQNLDLGDPIPGHCAYEDSGFWVTEDGGCKDVATGVVYSWWSGDTVFAGTQAEMIAWCEDLEEGDKDDWVLPNKDIMIASALNGAHGHLNFDTGTTHFMSSSGKRLPYLVSFATAKAYKVGGGSTSLAVCARNLPPKKPPKK